MEIETLQPNKALYSLRLRWTALAGLSLAFLFITARLLAGSLDRSTAIRWLALSLGVTLPLLWTLWRNLPFNHRQDESNLLPSLGAANMITFLRGLLVAATAGFILVPPPDNRWVILPAAFYTLSTLGDFFDGYFARHQDHATHLGEILDMVVDGIGVLTAALLLVSYGKVPTWFLLVGLARYLFLAGIWLRRRLDLPVHPLPPSDVRRALASVQMNFIVILLWPLFSPPATYFAAAAFAVPFLANFLYDWFTVTGAIKSQHAPNALKAWIRRTSLKLIPLLLRLTVFIISIVPALVRLPGSDSLVDLDALLRLSSQEFPSIIPLLLIPILPLMLLLGFAGRSAALAGLVLLGISQNFTPLTSAQMLLVILFAAVFHLGTGPLSLWKPEDRLFALRAGQHRTNTTLLEAAPSSEVPLNSRTSLPEAS
jgi:CDP-diacylglycerol--glycerol-3-phosphate 3-phosphatidyltransferase